MVEVSRASNTFEGPRVVGVWPSWFTWSRQTTRAESKPDTGMRWEGPRSRRVRQSRRWGGKKGLGTGHGVPARRRSWQSRLWGRHRAEGTLLLA